MCAKASTMKRANEFYNVLTGVVHTISSFSDNEHLKIMNMQNEKTLIKLGFHKNNEGYWELSGNHQTFLASVVDFDGPIHVQLSKLHPNIDKRESSPRKGLHFISQIKQCCSDGSIERAILKYDVPEERYSYHIGYCSINAR